MTGGRLFHMVKQMPQLAWSFGSVAFGWPRAIDALREASGTRARLVQWSGRLSYGSLLGSVRSRRQRVLVDRDAALQLRTFGRLAAFEVTDLWDAPPAVRAVLSGDGAVTAPAQMACFREFMRPLTAAASAAISSAALALATDEAHTIAWAAARESARARSIESGRLPDEHLGELNAMLESLLLDAMEVAA